MRGFKMKIAGIVGGMGSLATVDFLKKVVKHTKAEKDQDHIRMIVDFNTSVPDRTAAILDDGEDPTLYLVESVKMLEREKADFAVFICNTAYAFLDRVQKQVNIPVLNLPEMTLRKLKSKGIEEIWLTGTRGLLNSRVYQREAEKIGLTLKIPEERLQESLMQIIYTVKAGQIKKASLIWFSDVEPYLDGHVLLGCTELPVAAKSKRLHLIDVNDEWAKIVIEICGAEVNR